MRVGAFLRQKTAVFVVLLCIVLFSFSVITCASTDPFPHKGDLHLPQGTTVIPENAVTGIEEGDLYIPSGTTLHLESNATFIWNPGYSIYPQGQITMGPGARLIKGYLCVSVDGIHGCWQDPTFCADLPCPLGYVQWKDVWDLPSCDEEPVHFPDPNLEQAIREAISKPTGDIYKSDLVGLAYFDASGRGIANLEGIQYCTDLKHLYLLNNHQISDISPLAGLTSLTTLNLRSNQISDTSPLAGLTSLIHLNLDDNQISNISPLAGLTSLTWLHLSYNQISDTSPLAGLTSLIHLELDDNQISNISPLAGLTNLTWLWLRRNQISDTSPLAGLTSLIELDLNANQISDISPLAGLTSLTWLWLSYNQISDISPLAGLTSLTWLYLDTNQISDTSPLAGLTSLTWLWLSRNQISDTSPLAGLTSLTHLYLTYNQISDTSPLAGLTSLTWLQLAYNQISDTSPLAGLTSLTGLHLENNQISDTSPLAGLTSLTGLHLDDNQISDISPLAGLTSLTRLYLENNQISDIQALVDNAGLGAGDRVDIYYNYLDLTPGSDDIQNIQVLINRGVNVLYEPQNPPENHPPIARALDISGQPQTMYPDTVYSVTAKYYDPDGRNDLKYCYLRLNHPTKPLTMMWYQSDGHAAPWAGEEGENYLTITNVNVTEIANSSEGYELTWSFQINDQWPEVENAIDFGVFASDDSDLISDWDYDDKNASFFLAFFNPILAIPVCGPTQLEVHIGTTVMFVLTVRNGGNKTDTIHLSITYDYDWNISLSKEWVTNLPPGGTQTVSLTVPVKKDLVNSIDIIATSDSDPTKSSRWTVEVQGHSGEAFFLVKAAFVNKTPDTHQLYFEVPDYVKISGHLLLIGRSSAHVYALFDPEAEHKQPHSFDLGINELTTGEQITIRIDFNTDEIIATGFHMSEHSYNFPNFGPYYNLGIIGSGRLSHCFGMSETSILYFEDRIKLPDGVSKTYDLEKDQVKKLLIWYQWRGRASWKGVEILLTTANPIKQYKILEQSIRAGRPMIIAIKGHAVVAYAIVKRESVSYILIYDSEAPLGPQASPVPEAFPYATYTGNAFNYDGHDKFLALEPVKRLLDLVILSVECPIDVTITDQYGRGISNTGINNIPGADVWMDETGEIKIFYLPLGLDYQARFDAYAEGIFDLTLFLPCTGEIAYVSTFDAVFLEERGKAELTFAAGSPASIMMIDINNDGVIDEMKNPATTVIDQSGLIPVTPVVPPLRSINHGPNPVPPEGCIFWLNLPDDTLAATLKIFDIDGALLVSIPLDPTADRYPAAGRWIPEDDLGRLLGTGLYLYLVEIEHTDGSVTYSPVQKMVIQR